MNYQEKISKIEEKIKNKEFESAEQDLLNIINEEEFKKVEDEEDLHFSFYNYIETLIYWRKFQPSKKILPPANNIADAYFLLGYINYETKNYGKAVQYLDKAIEWNPISPRIRMEKADAYREMKEYERYRIEIEKAYQYIYDSTFMSKYFRELGWYYSEKRIYDLANALYTQSIVFMDTKLAKNELMYIAQQENREPRLSTQDEIIKLFKEYNIPFGVNNEITQIIYEDSQQLLKENEIQLANYLYRALYDITLDKRFMLYVELKDEKTGITVKIPEIWKTVNKEEYSKNGISDNTIFLFRTPKNENISIVCDGKCESNQLDEACKLNIENMEKEGINIEEVYATRGQKNINQVYALVQAKEKQIRISQNYLVVNGYLLNVSWEVPNSIPLEKLMESENNSLKNQMIFSLKGENENNQNVKIKEYSQPIKGLPTFKFYFPENMGEYSKFNNNIFELKKDNIQKIRVMISKCDSEENFEKDAKKWIEKNKADTKMEEIAYRKEKIGNYPIEVYVLRTPKRTITKIYKIGYVNGCRITISGRTTENKEEIINQAFETLKWEEEKTIKKPIIVKCNVCNHEFKLNWNVPASEKTFYCKCPNCNAEIKSTNPNYKG